MCCPDLQASRAAELEARLRASETDKRQLQEQVGGAGAASDGLAPSYWGRVAGWDARCYDQGYW